MVLGLLVADLIWRSVLTGSRAGGISNCAPVFSVSGQLLARCYLISELEVSFVLNPFHFNGDDSFPRSIFSV